MAAMGSGRSVEGVVPAVAPSIVHEVLATPGTPLPAGLAATTAARLGFDPSTVRIHCDARAAASARAVGASAYTVGRHIVFAAGAFAPDSVGGEELLRHELQHAAEQGDAPLPGLGGLRVEVDPGRERTAELAERGGFTRPGAALGPVLQRRREPPRRTAPVEEVQQRVLGALQRLDGNGAVSALAELGPGGGPELVRRVPEIRRRVALVLGWDQRIEALVRLSGGDASGAHLQAARGFVRSRRDGALAVASVETVAAARQLEAAFNRDLFDLFPFRPTLVRCLQGPVERGVAFNRPGNLIVPADVPILRAWMLIDHQPSDVEADGLALAEERSQPILRRLREVSAHGRKTDELASYAAQWTRLVVKLEGWSRSELYLTHGWCLLALEETLREQLPEGPLAQVRTFFDELRSREAARAELKDFDDLVARVGRGGALERYADTLRRSLQSSRFRDFVGGDGATSAATIRSVFDRLRFWRVADIQALAQTYQRVAGRELAAEIRGLAGRGDEKFGLLGLLTTGASYVPYVRLAQAVFRREVAEAHRVLYGVPDSARSDLLGDYKAAFAGLLENDGVATAYRHVRAEFDGKRQWELEKTQVLLDALPTTAEELYFQTLPLVSANQSAARKTLEATRSGGAPAVRKLHDEWESRVRTQERSWNGLQGLTDKSLREALRGALSGDHRNFAEALSGSAPQGLSIRDLTPGLRAFQRAVFSRETAAIKRELTRLEAVLKAVRGQDKDGANAAAIEAAERQIREYLGAQARVRSIDDEARKQSLALYTSGGKTSDADEIYRQWKLRPTFGSNEDASKAILAIVTRRWLESSLRALTREADTPTKDPRTGEELRPAYSLATLIVTRGLFNGRDHAIFNRIHFMYVSDHGRVETAAIRLWLELQAPGFTAQERVAGALEFLGMVKDELPAVIARFVATNAPDKAGPPAEAFIDYLIDDFGLAKEVPQLADLARGTAGDTAEVLTRGRLAEATRHTGFFSGVAGWLAAAVGGRDLRPAIQTALRNLEAIANDARIQPEQLARNAARAGRASPQELAEKQYEDLKAFIADENALKAEAAAWVQFTIEVVLRAGLVALFGPAGLAGALIGVGTVAGGRIATGALLGANYEVGSEANVADVLTEITGPLYEAIKLEDRIGKLVNQVVRGPFGRKVFTSAATKLSTATIDGAIERGLRQNGAPDFDRTVGVVVGSFVEGLGKVVADRVTLNVTTFTEFNERWLKQTAKQFLVGPPPKASVLASGISQLVKFAQDYHLKGKEELDLDDIERRFFAWIATTLLTGASVGTSFTINKHREARQRARNVESRLEDLATLGAQHPRFREIVEALPPDQRGLALLNLARDRDFGRARIPGRYDPTDESTRFNGRTQRAELEAILKAVPEAGKAVDEKALAKVRGDAEVAEIRNNRLDDRVAARQREDAARARALAADLNRAQVDAGVAGALQRRREERRARPR